MTPGGILPKLLAGGGGAVHKRDAFSWEMRTITSTETVRNTLKVEGIY